MSTRGAEELVPFGKRVAAWLIVFAPRNMQARTLKALRAVDEHRPVFLTEDVASSLDHQVRPNAQDLSIEGRVVQRAEREAVRDHRHSARMAVRENMGR